MYSRKNTIVGVGHWERNLAQYMGRMEEDFCAIHNHTGFELGSVKKRHQVEGQKVD